MVAVSGFTMDKSFFLSDAVSKSPRVEDTVFRCDSGASLFHGDSWASHAQGFFFSFFDGGSSIVSFCESIKILFLGYFWPSLFLSDVQALLWPKQLQHLAAKSLVQKKNKITRSATRLLHSAGRGSNGMKPRPSASHQDTLVTPQSMHGPVVVEAPETGGPGY